jgi:hypothetical protein
MVQINQDLPLRLSEVMTCSLDLPPGASPVRQTVNRGTGWYCQSCNMYINPIYMRDGEAVFPACLECFVDEVLKEGGGDVAVLEKEAVPDPVSVPAS